MRRRRHQVLVPLVACSASLDLVLLPGLVSSLVPLVACSASLDLVPLLVASLDLVPLAACPCLAVA